MAFGSERRVLAAAVALLIAPCPAAAHPHAWVTAQTTVLFDHGAITGLQHAWTFDELYTAMAVEGLDTNGDGNFDRQELTELAQENIDGLRDVGYYTFAKLGDDRLTFKPPVDYWLAYNDSSLTLHFTLPLENSAASGTKRFSFAVYDPTFFIAFSSAKVDPVKLGARAPPGCEASTTLPEKDAAEIERQGEIFPLGRPSFGLSVTAPGSVQCPMP